MAKIPAILRGFLQRYGKKTVSTIPGWAFPDTYKKNNDFRMTSPSEVMSAYELVSYVGFCANLRAYELSVTPLQFFAGEREAQSLPPLLRGWLDVPYPGITLQRWLYQASLHLLLDGNFFAVKRDRSMYDTVRGTASALLPLNPGGVRVLDQGGSPISGQSALVSLGIGGYEARIGSTWYSLPSDQIIHINSGSPHNPWRGLGVLARNVPLIEDDRLLDQYNKAFFNGGAIANLLIKPDKNMLAKDWEAYKKDIRREYGYQKEPIMIMPPGTEVDSISYSSRDVELQDRKKLTKEDVCMMFGVPRQRAGLESRYAEKEQADREWEKTLSTDYQMIESGLSAWIDTLAPGLTMRFARQDTHETTKLVAKADLLFRCGAITPQGVQAMMGQPVDPAASTQYYLPMGVMPADMADDPIPAGPEAGQRSIKADKSRRMAEAMQWRIHRRALRTKAKTEKAFLRLIADTMADATEAVVAEIKDTPIRDAKGLIDTVQIKFGLSAKARIQRDARRVYQASASAAVRDGNELFDLATPDTTTNPKVILVAEKLAIAYADRFVDGRREELRQIIDKAVVDGVATSEIKGRITEWAREYGADATGDLAGSGHWRAMRLARTEASNAWAASQKINYDELGVQLYDVIGCMMFEDDSACGATEMTWEQIESIGFHPNHIGTTVPAKSFFGGLT